MGSLILAAVALPGAGFLFLGWRNLEANEWYRIDCAALPEDGTPRLRPVHFAQQDGWALLPEKTVGHVFVRRAPETGEIMALETRHSRGMAVVYDADKGVFRCPCWGVEFDLNGRVIDSDSSPTMSIRQLKTKEWRGEVYVRRERP
jgi:nitrite reductase/ring-hydroxylating ferredoxin subunit